MIQLFLDKTLTVYYILCIFYMAGFVYLREASKNQKEIKMFKKIDENRVHGHKNPLKTTHI